MPTTEHVRSMAATPYLILLEAAFLGESLEHLAPFTVLQHEVRHALWRTTTGDNGSSAQVSQQ